MAAVKICTRLLVAALFPAVVFRATVVGKGICDRGGNLMATEIESYIMSPTYPEDYPNETNCSWIITADSDSSEVELQFLNFTLFGDFPACDTEFVQLFDGRGVPLTLRLCGQGPYPVVTSPNSRLVIFFYTRFYGGVFELAYRSVKRTVPCSEATVQILGHTPNDFSSSNNSINYSWNLSCQWRITTNLHSPRVALLKLIDWDLEELHPEFMNESVEGYDGRNANSHRRQLLCSQVSPAQHNETDPNMTAVFPSDGSGNFKDFRFEFLAHDKEAECTLGLLRTSATAGLIASPGYPDNYPSDTDYQWGISVGSSFHVIVLKLLDLHLEGSSPSCIQDHVAIYDGPSSDSPRIQMLCGLANPATQYISSNNSMTVVFHSDEQNNFRGFKFEYTSMEKSATCGNKILLSSEGIKKIISTPNYPNNYPSFMDCQWQIVVDSALVTSVVVLDLLDFYLDDSLPGCLHDYVTIYDGLNSEAPIMETLCGQVSRTQLISSFLAMTLVFHSNSQNTFRGFQFEYTSKPKTVLCGNTSLLATDTANYFTSPRYPSNYTDDIECHWRITAASLSQVIMLTLLDFQLEEIYHQCITDYVRLYYGFDTLSLRYTQLCGKLSRRQFLSAGPYMTVVFTSNLHTNGRGFVIEYINQNKSAWCAMDILIADETDRYLTSPNYPNLYPGNLDCLWNITTGPNSSVVVLNIVQFNLKKSGSECLSDNVKIYDGPSTTSPLMKVLCGDVNNGTFVGTESDMTIAFHSLGENVHYTGFNLIYQSQKKLRKGGGCKNNSSIITMATCCVALVMLQYLSSLCCLPDVFEKDGTETLHRLKRNKVLVAIARQGEPCGRDVSCRILMCSGF